MSLALESPLAYLDFYEPTPSSNFVNDTKLPYTFYADNTQEDCYSDFEWDFESLPALEEISDLEDSGSSCSLFEFDDLESLGNGTESLDFTHINEFNTLYNHDRCQDTIEMQKQTINLLVNRLQTSSLELEKTQDKLKQVQCREEKESRRTALVSLRLKIELEVEELYENLIQALPFSIQPEVFANYPDYETIQSNFTDQHLLSIISHLHPQSTESILLVYFKTFSQLSNNRGEILIALLAHFESLYPFLVYGIDRDDARSILSKGHTFWCHKLMQEAFDVCGEDWRENDKRRALGKVVYDIHTY